MFGCLRRAGCLALVLVIIAALWLTQARWRPRVFGERTETTVTWHAVQRTGGEGVRNSVETLGRKSGPVFINLSAEELGALLLSSAGNRLPRSVSNPRIAISGDRVLLRATIQLDELRGIEDLGPLARVLSKQEEFETSGTLEIVHPGLGQYRIESAKLGSLAIPKPMIPKLLSRASRAERYEGVAENGLPFEIPSYIGDVRVARDRVTLYKNVK